MLTRLTIAAGVSGLMVVGLADAAHAQVARRGPFAGPTTLFAVPQAYVLPTGSNLVNGTLYLGGFGTLGLPTNGLSLSAHMGMGPGFELDTGLMATGLIPWTGALSLTGKWNLVAAGGPVPTISTLAGGLVSVNANGQPALGLQVGLPISLALPVNAVNAFGFTLNPAFNVTVGRPGALLPGGTWPDSASFLSLGLGAEFRALPNVVLLADSNLGIPGLTGINTQSNLGVRIGVGRSFLLDGFVGVGTNYGLAPMPTSLGLAGHWVY